MLYGENAFYKRPNYAKTAKKEFSKKGCVESTIYTTNTESKVWRIAKIIFSVLIFPVGIYYLLHAIAGKVSPILPATNPSLLMGAPKNWLYTERQRISFPPGKENLKYKRITIKVDGYKIDTVIMINPSSNKNKRWVIKSNGNGEFYEEELLSKASSFKRILSGLDANGIVFNYPGVGSSTGMPNRDAMAKAYKAILRFLTDKKNGAGATEIIGYGYSIGGGVQGEALNTHKLCDGVKHAFVKDRTFADLASTGSHIVGGCLGHIAEFFIRLSGWNISPTKSSRKLKVLEIILQGVDGNPREQNFIELTAKNAHLIKKSDGVIPKEGSLAMHILKGQKYSKTNKHILGIFQRSPNLRLHSQILHTSTVKYICKKVSDYFQSQNQAPKEQYEMEIAI